MKKIIFFLIIILSSTISTAQEECTSCTEVYNTIFSQQLTQEQFAQEITKIQLPTGVQTALGEKVIINLHLEDKEIGVKIQEGKIQAMQETAFENPKISIWTTTTTLKKIIASPDKKAAVQEALKKEEIKYQGHTIGVKIKLKIAKKIFFKEETLTGRMIQRIEHLKDRQAERITKTLKYQHQ